MTGVPTAVEVAQQSLGLTDAPVEVWTVHRLHKPGSYYLIVFGQRQSPSGVAAVEVSTHTFMTGGLLAGTEPNIAITSEAAIKISGLDVRGIRLVWKPSLASKSPLYPLWEVCGETHCIYVDQMGRLWAELDSQIPGA